MRRWLGWSDEEIIRRRNLFVTFLKDRFNIIIDPMLLESEEAKYPSNVIGGVAPYSGNQRTGFRVVTSVAKSYPPIKPLQYDDQRLIEVGFKYLDAKLGMIKQGVYVIENYRSNKEESIFGVPLGPRVTTNTGTVSASFPFQTRKPSTVNEVNEAAIFEDVGLNAFTDDGSK